MRPVSNRRISTSAICRTNSVKLLRTSKGSYTRIDLKTVVLLALLPTAQLLAQVERASVSKRQDRRRHAGGAVDAEASPPACQDVYRQQRQRQLLSDPASGRLQDFGGALGLRDLGGSQANTLGCARRRRQPGAGGFVGPATGSGGRRGAAGGSGDHRSGDHHRIGKDHRVASLGPAMPSRWWCWRQVGQAS